MDISNYLHDIPALIMTAIAALGGTATAIGTLFAWVSKVVKSLKAGKADYESKATDYEEKAQRLEERSAKLSATGETFEKFGATLTAYGEDFARLVRAGVERVRGVGVLGDREELLLGQEERAAHDRRAVDDA